jgi:hypothetical protein
MMIPNLWHSYYTLVEVLIEVLIVIVARETHLVVREQT